MQLEKNKHVENNAAFLNLLVEQDMMTIKATDLEILKIIPNKTKRNANKQMLAHTDTDLQ